MREYARALAEFVIAQASVFETEGRPKPVAVRLTAEEWEVLKGFLVPLLEAGEQSLFGMRVELVGKISEGDRFAS